MVSEIWKRSNLLRNLRKSSFEALVSTRHWRGGWLSCPVSALSLTWTLSQFPSDHHHRIWWHQWSRVSDAHVPRVPVTSRVSDAHVSREWCPRVTCQWCHVSRVTYASDVSVSEPNLPAGSLRTRSAKLWAGRWRRQPGPVFSGLNT